MSRPAWETPQQMGGDLDGIAYNATSRQTAVGISRSQDDATVSYHFQRPQSENDLQAYGGGKRWAIGDDMLVEQVCMQCVNSDYILLTVSACSLATFVFST